MADEFHFERLVTSIEGTSWWRAEKAQQYPDDERNDRCSETLAEIADGLKTLPPDNEHRSTYERAWQKFIEFADNADRIGSISNTEDHFISRYGFDYPRNGDPSVFLSELNQVITEEFEVQMRY